MLRRIVVAVVVAALVVGVLGATGYGIRVRGIANEAKSIAATRAEQITVLSRQITVSETRAASLALEAEQANSLRLRLAAVEETARQLETEAASLRSQIPQPEPVSEAWKLVVGDAPFEPRDGAFVASFKGYIWLVNGYTGGQPFINSIWRSKNGSDWFRIVEEAPWPNSHLGGLLSFNGRLWMLGGDFDQSVWSSEDGIHWRKESDTVPWGGRYNAYMGVFDGRMWVMGGLDEDNQPLRDVWASADGTNWDLVTSAANWPPRGLISGFVVHQGAMWILGGGTKVVNPAYESVQAETLVELSDVWKSTDGARWELVNARAPWHPRTHLSVASFAGHIVITDGSVGSQGTLSNEAWQTKDGIEWVPVGGSAKQRWPARHASSLIKHDGSLYLIGGYLHNDVWRLDASALN